VAGPDKNKSEFSARSPVETKPNLSLRFSGLKGGAFQLPEFKNRQWSTIMQLKFYSQRVVFEGDSYFVRGANRALLGAWGKKKEPIAAKNYIDVEGVLGDRPPMTVPDHDSPTFTATFSSTFKVNHIGSMNLPIKLFNLGIDDDVAYQMLREGNCRFKCRTIRTHDLRLMLNNAPRFRDLLKQDNDYRFVTSVIWMESCTITSDKDHDWEVDGKFSLGMGGDDSGTERRDLVFEYGPDSILGYGLHKIDWDKKSAKKRDKVDGFKPDWQGLS
jgi:hypothetical protein